MVLDKERLSEILSEIDDGLLDSIKISIRKLQAELIYLDTDEAHQSMIRELALRSPSMDDGIAGNSAADLAALENSIERYAARQKEILRESLRQCMDRQTVAYHVFRSFLRLREREKKMIITTVKNSLEYSIPLLEKEGIRISKYSLCRQKNRILEQMLAEVNKEISVIEDYEGHADHVTGKSAASGSGMV